MPAEIQLLPCGYSACCSVDQCQFRATTLVRYTDNQGRPLHVNRSTIDRLLKRNQILAFRIGRHWRFNLEEIDNWCASHALSKEPNGVVGTLVLFPLNDLRRQLSTPVTIAGGNYCEKFKTTRV